MAPQTRRVRALLSRKSAREIEKALQRVADDFADWELQQLELRERQVDGSSIPELVIVLK